MMVVKKVVKKAGEKDEKWVARTVAWMDKMKVVEMVETTVDEKAVK